MFELFLSLFLSFSCSCNAEDTFTFASKWTSIGTFLMLNALVLILFIGVVYDYVTSPAFVAQRAEAKRQAIVKKEEQSASKAVEKEKRSLELQKKLKAQREKEAALLRRKLERLQQKQLALELNDILEEPSPDQIVPVAVVEEV